MTNARALWLFNSYLKGDQGQKLVAKLDLLGFNTDEEFEAIFEQIWLLSKASLSSPTAINSWMEQRRLDRGLRALLLNPHSAAVKALARDLAVTAGVEVAPEAIVQWVRGQLTPNLSIVKAAPAPPPVYEPKEPPPSSGPRYWMLPCGPAADGAKPIAQLHRWLDKGFWGFGKSTPGRTHLRAGDYVCFYVNKTGVAAMARIAGPADTLVTAAEYPEPYPLSEQVYKVPLRDIAWLHSPRPVTKAVRAQLEAFAGKDLDANPGWLFQTTRALSAHDFRVLVSGDAA